MTEARRLIAGTTIRYELSDWSDPAAAAFSCGTRPHCKEINDAIREKSWFLEDPRPSCYRFDAVTDEGDSTVGFAIVQVFRYNHPSRRARSKSPYLYIELLGLNTAFQQTPDPIAGISYAKAIMREIETALASAYPDVVGILAITSPTNLAAIGLLQRKCGFQPDADGEYREDAPGRVPRIMFRKLRADWEL